jgi:predicted metal-binding membrane protein
MLRLSMAEAAGRTGSPRKASRRVLSGALALAFAASVVATASGDGSMASMAAMPMPGGWMLSMAWMRMCGQAWPAAAAGFLGMWMPMMAAMMLPSLTPVLSRYHRAVEHAGGMRPGRMAAVAGLGYFLVWAAAGAALYPLGAAWAEAVMRDPRLARAVPFGAGVTVVLAGLLQFTAWKARRLACCRVMPGIAPAGMAAGLRHGIRMGIDCVRCCGHLMAIALAAGIMDLRAMAAVTLAVTAERLLPAGDRVARGIGLLAIGTGLLLIVRAAVPG